MTGTDASIEELNQWMLAHHMHGYWMQQGGASSSQRKPQHWKWANICGALMKAGDLVPMGPSGLTEVRTIDLRHPSERSAPRTISLSPQILLPGERGRAHHSVTNETRFVVQAPRGMTCVIEGEAFSMEPGDLVVSPAGADQAYDNLGAEPAIWLTGRDRPLLDFMAIGTDRAASADRPRQPVHRPFGYFAATQDRMKDLSVDSAFHRPPTRYPWADIFASLVSLKESEIGADLCDGIHLRYTSPRDRGPTLPTFSCEIQLLTPPLQTDAHRHNSTAIYYVVRGEGRTEVGEEWLEWTQGDIFCVPPWTWHRHENRAPEDAILYSIDDWPAMAKMGFYRVEREGDTPE